MVEADAGAIGKDNIHGWPFDLYVHHGAGAYICGEETAMLELLEGKKGMPRMQSSFFQPAWGSMALRFMTNLDRINALAERSEGFVWRLKDESNNATAIRPESDPATAVNLSVWESVEALERFVWATVHKQFYNRKAEWFEKDGAPHFVMWPIAEGHIPDLVEAMGRLDL